MPAVHKFYAAVRKNLQYNHCGVFPHLASAEEIINENCSFGQRPAGEHERVDDSLQGRRHDGGWNTFVGDISDCDANTVGQRYHIVKISADGVARDRECTEFGVVE